MMMTINNEIEVYNKSIVDQDGELELWDNVIFPNIIRKRQIEYIRDVLINSEPISFVLDFGCGAGWLIKTFSDLNYNFIGVDSSSF